MGWLSDLASVSEALKANFSQLGPIEKSDLTVGLAYLWQQREEAQGDLQEAANAILGSHPDAGASHAPVLSCPVMSSPRVRRTRL